MTKYDCIVVGARCAGAPLAVHLVRAGMRVLVVDADPLHSDQPFSTHVVQAPGMDLLDELGVGDHIRACTPPLRTTRLDVLGHVLEVPQREGRELYCPRRSTLDPLLQDAAIAAGAELRASTRVTALHCDGDRVAGVHIEHKGRSDVLRAPWVIGADGRNSSVARLANARAYIEHETERGGYWAYWPKPRCWDNEDPWRRFQSAISIDRVLRFAFECDGERLIMGAVAPVAEARAWGKRYAEELRRSLLASPLTAALVGAEPLGPVWGLLKARYFFREPVGPGWALVGDSGLHKDATPGHGITDALRDAKALANALLDGRDEALAVYWRRRDVDAVPLYFHALSLGRVGFANAFNAAIMDCVQADAALKERMRESLERERSPFDVLTPGRAFREVGRMLLRRRWDVLPNFIASARYATMVQRELAARTRLLDLANDALARAGRRSRALAEGPAAAAP